MPATLASAVLSLVAAFAFVTPRASAQTGDALSQAQLEQLVAPIALHPDALLAQILISSTYPLEIFEAQRWVERNPGLAGAALESALAQRAWDPSVKAMCGFPSVLAQMYDNLEWTRDLGDALLARRVALLATVQSLRRMAVESGQLKTTEQQTVGRDDAMVVITPTSADVIHVPSYLPLVVYGAAWHYPTYRYPTFYAAPAAGHGAVTFSAGIAWSAALYTKCDWRHGDVIVDVDSQNVFDERTSRDAKESDPDKRGVDASAVPNTAARQVVWRHDPAHRQGVSYASAQIARQYGAARAAAGVPPDRARGYGDTPAARATSSSDSVFSGSRSTAFDRLASERGAASLGAGVRRR